MRLLVVGAVAVAGQCLLAAEAGRPRDLLLKSLRGMWLSDFFLKMGRATAAAVAVLAVRRVQCPTVELHGAGAGKGECCRNRAGRMLLPAVFVGATSGCAVL